MRPVGYGSDSAFYAYNSHYKASTGSNNENRRNAEATTIRNNADALGDGANIIYAGDFNIRSSNEEMYQTLLGDGPGQAFDPIDQPGLWNNRSQFQALHTQSPADGSVPGLITGGVDDRFDFQLVTGELLDQEGLDYLPGSYHVFGNNGTHGLNNPINSAANTSQPDAILDLLAQVTDHLPVVADYQLPAIMDVDVNYPARVLTGASANLTVSVTNAADVQSPIGADELDFSGEVKGAIDAEDFSGQDAALNGGQVFQLALETDSAGSQLGRVIMTSDSPGVPQDEIRHDIPFEVLNHATGSFIPNLYTPSTTIDFGVIGWRRPLTKSVEFYNVGTVGNTAQMDIDEVSPSGDVDDFATDVVPREGIAVGESAVMNFTASADQLGDFSATWTLTWSDEDLPGELQNNSTVNATAQVALPGDANLDGVVDVRDFNIWNDHRSAESTDWSTGDFNGDGVSDEFDFSIWSDFRFMTAADMMAASVPEPNGLLFCCVLLIGYHHQSRRQRVRNVGP